MACRKDEMVGVRQKDFMEDIPAEQYMPNASREVITLESGVTVNKIDSVYVLGGDMILNDRQLELLNCPQSRGAMTGTLSNYWPRGEVYYDIDSKFGDNSAVVKAMTMISDVCGVKFIRRTNQNDYIYLVPSDTSNASMVGKQGGRQLIYIADRNVAGIIAHEIKHSLGIYHEMSRKDRDNYITINWGNIEAGASNIFQQYSSYDIGGFDYNSIMMYSSTDFAIDLSVGSFTTKNGEFIYKQRSFISNSDALALRFIYGPTYCKEVVDVDENIREGLDYIDYAAGITRTITFYSDSSCTTPAPLSEDRLFVITRTEERVTGSGSAVPHVIEERIIMHAGTTSYTVEDREYYTIDRGDLREHYKTETNVRSVIWY